MAEIKKETAAKAAAPKTDKAVKAEKAQPAAPKAEAQVKPVKSEPKAAKQEKPVQKKADGKRVKITLIKSTIGCLDRQKKTVEALGLRKIRQSVIHADDASTRGMIFVVKHLVKVEEVV